MPEMTPPALHPCNSRFVWKDHAGPFRLVSAEQARQYDRDGYFLLEGAVDADTLAEVVAAIDPFDAETEGFLADLDGGQFLTARAGKITFTVYLASRNAALRRFVSGHPFADLVADLLGPDVLLYHDQSVYKKPGTEEPFPWHQDNGYNFIEPQQYLTCWVALTDATEDNGCPWVVPGLHRLGTFEHHGTDGDMVCFDDWPDEAVPVPARAGDIVVFSSLTPHATGPNRTTDEVRKAYIVQFAHVGVESVAADGTRGFAGDAANQFPVVVDGRPVTPT